MHCLGKLNRMHVTVQHLQETKIGKTVNGLRKDEGEVGVVARALVAKWKNMVNQETSDASEVENAQDELRCNVDGQNHNDNDSGNMKLHSVSRSERKLEKTHEHTIKSGNSNNNHIHSNNHHRHHEPMKISTDQSARHAHRSMEKVNDTQNHHIKVIHSMHIFNF